MSSFCVFVHEGYCLDHGLSSSCTKEMLAVRKLSVWYKISIWSNSLTLSMKANSSGAEFLSTISKFMKRMNFVIVWLRPLQNVKLGIFTGSRSVDGKEMYKKAWYMIWKLLFCLVKLLLIWISHRRRIFKIVIRQKQNILGANSVALADSSPNVFSTHR